MERGDFEIDFVVQNAMIGSQAPCIPKWKLFIQSMAKNTGKMSAHFIVPGSTD